MRQRETSSASWQRSVRLDSRSTQWTTETALRWLFIISLIGPILWGHSGPLCHALSGPDVTKIVHNVYKFILFNLMKSELRYCNPFVNGSATKEIGPRKTPMFYFNWLPWQCPLTNRKKLNRLASHFTLLPILKFWWRYMLGSKKQVLGSRLLKTRSIWKMLGPFATTSRLTHIQQMSLAVLSRAACASMSTTSTTTTTTGDRGDRYGPMEWAQWRTNIGSVYTCTLCLKQMTLTLHTITSMNINRFL